MKTGLFIVFLSQFLALPMAHAYDSICVRALKKIEANDRYDNTRTLDYYFAMFPGLEEDIRALRNRPDAVIFESGAGWGRAMDGIQAMDGELKARLVMLSYQSKRKSTPQIQVLRGLLEDSLEQIPMFNLGIDPVGPILYSARPDIDINIYGSRMKENAKLYLSLGLDPAIPSGIASRVILPDGRVISQLDWIRFHISGLESGPPQHRALLSLKSVSLVIRKTGPVLAPELDPIAMTPRRPATWLWKTKGTRNEDIRRAMELVLQRARPLIKQETSYRGLAYYFDAFRSNVWEAPLVDAVSRLTPKQTWLALNLGDQGHAEYLSGQVDFDSNDRKYTLLAVQRARESTNRPFVADEGLGWSSTNRPQFQLLSDANAIPSNRSIDLISDLFEFDASYEPAKQLRKYIDAISNKGEIFLKFARSSTGNYATTVVTKYGTELTAAQWIKKIPGLKVKFWGGRTADIVSIKIEDRSKIQIPDVDFIGYYDEPNRTENSYNSLVPRAIYQQRER